MLASTTRASDVCIAGAGIIGLSLALELHRRGLRVTVLDQSMPLSEASSAAAGMLAAADPHNPPQLRALANLSVELYPAFLEQVQQLSGQSVPFQTHTTLQSIPRSSTENPLTASDLSHLLPSLRQGNHRFILLDEHSLDPRQLGPALLAAVESTSIDLRSHIARVASEVSGDGVRVTTPSDSFYAHRFIDCTGSWSASTPGIEIAPKKGQMFYLSLPAHLPLHFVVRTPEVYVVPRTIGPNSGKVLIGATVEDAGFNKTVHIADIRSLRALASNLLPIFAESEPIESWAGLRPGTSDDLPLLGQHPDKPNHLFATGHYRNGILLAPATARVMAQLVLGEQPVVDLSAMSPARGKPTPV